MKVLITGTPGVGKSTVAKIVGKRLGYRVVDISSFAKENKEIILEYDKERDTYVVDVEKLRKKLKNEDNVIVEGHLSHFLDGDVVVVLRLHPKKLKERLKSRGYSEKKIKENVEAEALDVCLIESVERHKNVFEVDTTGKSIEEVSNEILEIIENFKKGKYLEKYKPGKISWLEEIFDEV